MNTIRTPGRVVSVGEACKKLNPTLFGKLDPEAKKMLNETAIKPRKRIRQSAPKINRLEREAMGYLVDSRDRFVFRHHAMRLQLANGCTYTPDIVGHQDSNLQWAFEVKGKHAWDDAIVKLKVAAREWPAIQFVLLWKENNQWYEQAIIP